MNQTDDNGQRKPLFPLGQVVATPGVLDALKEQGGKPYVLLGRHIHGDWGDVGEEDCEANEWALQDGERLFSVYVLPYEDLAQKPLKVWVITEHDRSVTTLMLPEDY